ncbi:MAG TPA: sialate O-acetylesterase [Cyclobacteriaceae bacterium]|nr:sialate O-acetylesterase [Cyclobacteriaceae bacterium]
MTKAIHLILFVLAYSFAAAQLRLPALISDHMVLQQNTKVELWGWDGPNQKMAIVGSWESRDTFKTVTANTGRWRTTIKTPVAGGPYSISIMGSEKLVLKDVMMGEVWICSGQSNMEWNVNLGSTDAAAEMPKANFPNIRFFQVPKSSSPTPQEHGEGQWVACTPQTMKSFSAVGYFFGKKLHGDLKVPIGLINVSWGGTAAEVWTPAAAVDSDPELRAAAKALGNSEWWPKDPGIVYNSMIRPLVPYTLAGAIWYQGESNTAAPATYSKLMKVMIEQWRTEFQKDFPFYYVQIAPFAYGKTYEGALIREQQSFMRSIPNTGMVVISDAVDNVEDIHPKMKKPVGDRLANYALAETYKKPILGYQSPIYKSMSVEKNKARLSFHFGSIGLISQGGDPKGFLVAGEDQKFYPAIAKVEGETVVVYAKEVKVPVAVRFCFDNTTIPNLFNKEGLPVSVFRTDNWPLEVKDVEKKVK